MEIFRSVVIPGAPQCGTTSIFRCLCAHPQTCGSRVKELNYFTGDFGNQINGTKSGYAENFPCAAGPDRLLVEATPQYFRFGDSVARRIAETLPDAKILFCLRTPEKRLFTAFNKLYVQKDVISKDLDFERLVELALDGKQSDVAKEHVSMLEEFTARVNIGIYADVIEAYLQYFRPDQVHVVFLEDLQENPQDVLKGIARFLSIDGSFFDDYSFPVENKTVPVRWRLIHRHVIRWNQQLEPLLNRVPWLRGKVRVLYRALNANTGVQFRMSAEVSATLQEFYRPHNARLAHLLRTRLPEARLPMWLRFDSSG